MSTPVASDLSCPRVVSVSTTRRVGPSRGTETSTQVSGGDETSTQHLCGLVIPLTLKEVACLCTSDTTFVTGRPEFSGSLNLMVLVGVGNSYGTRVERHTTKSGHGWGGRVSGSSGRPDPARNRLGVFPSSPV